MAAYTLIENKRAKFDYQIDRIFVAGIQLSGGEVKSLRLRQASLGGSFVKIMNDDSAILLGAQITPYKFAENRDYDPKRTRRLLLRKSEIAKLKEGASQKGYTLVPLAFMVDSAFIKLKVGVARGKKQFEKRQQIKKRDLEREARRGEY